MVDAVPSADGQPPPTSPRRGEPVVHQKLRELLALTDRVLDLRLQVGWDIAREGRRLTRQGRRHHASVNECAEQVPFSSYASQTTTARGTLGQTLDRSGGQFDVTCPSKHDV